MKVFIKRSYVNCLYALIALGLVACSSKPKPELYVDTVSIYTEADTNQNSAIAVDLVFVYDQELAKQLGKMSASKYFSSSKQLLLDNPSLLDIWHWELVPGQIVQNFSPPQEKGDAFAAYVFANYLTPGDHRIKVSPEGVVKILLMKNDLKNLAAYDSPELRRGATSANSLPQKGKSQSDVCKPKLGPVKKPSAPCSITTEKTTQKEGKGFPCSPTYHPSQRKPLSIVKQPLAPPPSVSRKPCNYKVKECQK